MSTLKQVVLESKRFVIRKTLLGSNTLVRVTFKSGKKFEYEHDAVFKANKANFESMPCFLKYKSYTSSSNIPVFARDLAKEI